MAVADWSSVEFANKNFKSRRAPDFFSIMSDLLTMWDFVSCLVAGQGALSLYVHYVIGKPLELAASGPFRRDIVFGSIIAAVILRCSASLLGQKSRSPWRFVFHAEQRCGIAFFMLIAVGLATRTTDDLARLWLMLWSGLFALSVGCTRIGCSYYVRHLTKRGGLRESIAIIGASGALDRLAARIAAEANVVGTFCTQASGDLPPQEDADLLDLFQLGRDGGVDSFILALEHGQQLDDPHIIEQLKSLPVQVAVCRDDGWSTMTSSNIRLLGGLPMAVVADRPIKRWDLLLKTALDKIGAAILLLLLSPLLLGIGLAVGLNSPGPIIFRQNRQGWCGRDFTVFKFRTMYHTAGEEVFQTRRNDRRCTSVGRILRSTSLDELPQLWNVLTGDMSLVGPRPHAESLHDVDRAGREVVAEYAQRHRVRPGITGWAQVRGARGATATLEQLRTRVEYDLYYIENWSIWLDIRILLHTPFCLIGENVF